MEAMNDPDKPVHYTSKSEVCSQKARDTWTTTPSIIVHNDDEIYLSDSSDTSDTSDWDDHMLCDDEASLEAQLKAAQAAFRHSNGPDIVVPDNSGYDLRTINFNRRTFRGTGYFDVDETGDYDPSECESVDLPYSKKGRRKRLHGKKKQRSKIVTLVFRNSTSIAHIKQLIEEQAAHESRSLQPDKPDSEQISLGNPLARGCKCCFSSGVECSLIKDSFDYPCHVCADSGDDCIRFIQPAMKDPCMHCSQEGIDCSFKSGFGLGREVCLQCEQAGAKCFAAAAGSIRMNDVFENPDKLRYHFIPSLGRPYVECHECRSTGQSCNLQTVLDKTPCDNCSLSAAACTFEELSEDKHESAPSIHHNNAPRDPSSLFVTCEDVDEDVEMAGMGFQPAGADPPAAEADSELVEAMYIKTSFCHPIAFNIPREDDLGCDFCTGRNGLTGQYYATFGLGFDPLSNIELSPLVIPGKNGQGYQEISGGWQAWGKDFTRMCDACTFRRISILSCDQHEIRRMKDIDPEDEVPENILRIMVNMMQNVAQDIKFCSICPFPAFWECCTVRKSIVEVTRRVLTTDRIQIRNLASQAAMMRAVAYSFAGFVPPIF